jgi:hypothetical protein
MGFLYIAGGVALIVGGLLAKSFEVADGIALGGYKKKFPTWLGRVLSLLVGSAFIGVGILILLGRV